MYNKPTKIDENRWSDFWEKENFNLFLIWTTLNFEKTGYSLYICKEILDIEFERDWWVCLGATLGDGQKIKNYFSCFRDFSGKIWKCHIVGLRIYYKLTEFNQNRWGHFWENHFLIFLSCELPLILGVGGN